MDGNCAPDGLPPDPRESRSTGVLRYRGSLLTRIYRIHAISEAPEPTNTVPTAIHFSGQVSGSSRHIRRSDLFRGPSWFAGQSQRGGPPKQRPGSYRDDAGPVFQAPRGRLNREQVHSEHFQNQAVEGTCRQGNIGRRRFINHTPRKDQNFHKCPRQQRDAIKQRLFRG